MTTTSPFVSTTNACKLCKPLGAAIAFRGIEGCVPFLHGSQGCATYMRRYIISHFREPVDIASSSLGEKHAVYGGGPNLKLGLLNVMKKYQPKAIGVASTCLTETIGDDVRMFLHEFRQEFGKEFELPEIIHVSTPSYEGTHMEGYHAAVREIVAQLAEAPTDATRGKGAVNIIPGFVSAEDIRNLKQVLDDYGLAYTLLPDYSDTLDGPSAGEYETLPEGGTPIAAIKAMASAPVTIECTRAQPDQLMAGDWLEKTHGVRRVRLGMPIGIRECDAFFDALGDAACREMPKRYALERGRLVDAYVDAHKYVFGKRAVVYGEEDMVVGLTSFLAEIGIQPVLVATGGEGAHFEQAVADVTDGIVREKPIVRKGIDFYEIVAQAKELAPDLVIGNSKGYRILARELNIPLIRVGFPIHDRFGAQRVEHILYRGTQRLFDTIVNAIIEQKQDDSPVAFMYV